jgi:hypothetical protein
MWYYFHMLLLRASIVGCSDELCDCKSVTPTFDCSMADALLLTAPLCLLCELKKRHPGLACQLSGGLGLSNPTVMIVFLVQQRLEFGATWANFNLGPLDLLPFYFLASGGWDVRRMWIGPLRFGNECVLRCLYKGTMWCGKSSRSSPHVPFIFVLLLL